MRILITGASGLLGLNAALETTHRHTVFGTTHQHVLKTDAFKVSQIDLLAPGAVERLLDNTQPEWVIHCAALANLDACEADPALARQMNTDLPRTLASHVARGGARLVHISTDSVFDGVRGNYSEEDPPKPASVYSRTKLDGERAVAEVDPTAIIARVVFFGWSLNGKRSLAEFFFNNLTLGHPVMGFTDVFFCPLLANDLAWILIRMLELKLSGVYHVVSAEAMSKYEFGMHLARRFGLDGSLIHPVSVKDAGLQATRSPKLTLRTDKLAQALGEQLPTITSSLEGFYSLYQRGYPEMLHSMEQSGD